jgi:hypothetical protein
LRLGPRLIDDFLGGAGFGYQRQAMLVELAFRSEISSMTFASRKRSATILLPAMSVPPVRCSGPVKSPADRLARAGAPDAHGCSAHPFFFAHA